MAHSVSVSSKVRLAWNHHLIFISPLIGSVFYFDQLPRRFNERLQNSCPSRIQNSGHIETSNAHPWFADPFLKGLTWLLPVRLSKKRNCMRMRWGRCELRFVLPHLWSPLIFSWFILSKLRSIAVFSSSLYSNSECLYLNDKRRISLDAIRRATCAIFSATHFKQVKRVETTRLTLDCSWHLINNSYLPLFTEWARALTLSTGSATSFSFHFFSFSFLFDSLWALWCYGLEGRIYICQWEMNMRLFAFSPLVTLISPSRYSSFEQAPFPHTSLLFEPQTLSPNPKETDRKRIKSVTVILSEAKGAVARRSSVSLRDATPCSQLLFRALATASIKTLSACSILSLQILRTNQTMSFWSRRNLQHWRFSGK